MSFDKWKLTFRACILRQDEEKFSIWLNLGGFSEILAKLFNETENSNRAEEIFKPFLRKKT